MSHLISDGTGHGREAPRWALLLVKTAEGEEADRRHILRAIRASGLVPRVVGGGH